MYNGRITSIKEQTPEIRLFEMEFKDGNRLNFTPGQFAILELDGIKRAYSIASAPNEPLKFIIKLVNNGALTTKLWKLKGGDEIGISVNAFGHTKITNVPENADLLMIATGTGIAMFRSMIMSGILDTHKVCLISGARFKADIGFYDEFKAITNRNFTLIQAASREEIDGFRGRITDVLEDPGMLRLIPSLDPKSNLHVFVCGGIDMADSISEKFHGLGFTDWTLINKNGNFHCEKY